MERKRKNNDADKRGIKDENGKKDAASFTCGSLKKPSLKSEDVVDESSKMFYLSQIRNLELQVERYRGLCDQLQVKLQDSVELHEDRDREKIDIIYFLNFTLKTKNEELERVQSEAEVQRQNLQWENSKLRRTMEEMKPKMNNEISHLILKQSMLEKYQQEIEKVKMEREAILEELAVTKKAHRMEITAIECKQTLDFNRLKIEISGRVKQLAAVFAQDVTRQVGEMSRGVIHESALNQTLLCDMSSKIDVLLNENKAMRDEVKQMKREIKLMEEQEKQVMKRIFVLKKILVLMRDQLKKLRITVASMEHLKVEHEKTQKEAEDLAQQLQATKEAADALKTENTSMGSQLALANDEIEGANCVNVQLRRLLSEAAYIIKKALESHTGEDARESKHSIASKRSAVLQQLSLLLGGSAVLGIDYEAFEEAEIRNKAEDSTRCGVNAAMALLRIITSQRASTFLPAKWYQESLTHRVTPGDSGAIPQLSGQKMQGVSEDAKPAEKSVLKFSLLNRITKKLLNQI